METNKPTFLGIGAQKSGTTWLYYQLKKSDKVWLPRQKELHFFDRAKSYPTPSNLTVEKLIQRLQNRDLRKKLLESLKSLVKAVYRSDFDRARWIFKLNFSNYSYRWYQSLFKLDGPIKACGEISPSYHIVDKYEIEQMYRINPNLRLILLIRNPIERDWSAIRFRSAQGVDKVDFEDYKQVVETLNTSVYLMLSNYLDSINKFLEIFPEEQLLICFYDAISNDPYNLMKDIYIHIGLSEAEIDPNEMKKVVNPSIQNEMPEAVYNYLRERHINQIKELGKLLGSYAKIWAGDHVEGGELHPTVKVTFPDYGKY